MMPKVPKTPKAPKDKAPKDPDKPKGPRSAHTFYMMACRAELKMRKEPQATTMNFPEFIKSCGEQWKTLPAPVKAEFQKLADEDKLLYEQDMRIYEELKKMREQTGDPPLLKVPSSSYAIFCKGERPKVKLQFPQYEFGDIAKELGRRWSGLDPEVKLGYEMMAKHEKAEYERVLGDYWDHWLAREEEEKKKKGDAKEEEDGNKVDHVSMEKEEEMDVDVGADGGCEGA